MSIIPWNPDKCDPKLKEQGCQPTCSSNHCTSFQASQVYQQNCRDTGRTYAPVQTLECFNSSTHQTTNVPMDQILTNCQQLHSSNPDWNIRTCYCCCWCFARGTLMGVPDGYVKIETLTKGDKILAGTSKVGENKPALTWDPMGIEFAMGAENSHEPAMVYMAYGKEQFIVCSTDQVFMLSNGKLTTAVKLRPDLELIDKDGNPVPVHTVSIGHFSGGIYHIGTTMSFNGTADRHLMLAQGIVAGDYTLQLHFHELDSSFKVDNHDDLPSLGSPEYDESDNSLVKSEHEYIYSAKEKKALLHEKFTTYAKQGVLIPRGAQALFTEKQAADIAKNGNQRPISNPVGYSQVMNLIKLFKGFHPDILVHLEWGMNEPNVWAFKQYGENIVIVSGGLVRMSGFYFDGLAMAIAYGIACFSNAEPKRDNGLLCVGTADYVAYGIISHEIWYGQAWGGSILSAKTEWETLFKCISDQHAESDSLDICNNPGIKCREQTINSAIPGGSLPECAGGPKIPALELEQAYATKDRITLVFSQSLAKEQAEDAKNYILTPDAKVMKAELDPAYNFKVDLTTDCKSGDFTVTAKNLVSIYEKELDPEHSKARFSVK